MCSQSYYSYRLLWLSVVILAILVWRLPCETTHRPAHVFQSGWHGSEPGQHANWRKPILCMFSIIQEDMSRVAAGGGVCLCWADGGRPSEGQREVHLNKWTAWRDAETQTWTHFPSGDGVSKTTAPAVVEGIYHLSKCWQVCSSFCFFCTLSCGSVTVAWCCFQATRKLCLFLSVFLK